MTAYQLGYLAALAGFSNSGDWEPQVPDQRMTIDWELGWYEAHND